ncbi:MAG: class I SAM-dependent methyltransferase [Gammaproteobacteria bacterium]|nr:class I SAM-dependent methyltransferase [Candidatus Competibacteraceae bacterium]MCP5198213.1 class I SAM-dependent methyltransferase [Gammaproteobacteria bacterium]
MTLDIKRQEHLKTIRQYELQQALKHFPTKGHILEIGAGSGWQAQWLSNNGYKVTAVDIPESQYLQGKVFPIILYDGINLPFLDDSFDIIFSSNVLEHIPDPDKLDQELKRVLRSNGTAIHIVPTSTWRLWTILTHHFYILRLIADYIKIRVSKNSDRTIDQFHKNLHLSRMTILSRLLWPSRHGEHGTAIHELYLFSKKSWSRNFQNQNWAIKSCYSAGQFYTGNQILYSKLNTSIRSKLSRLLGSSSMIFFLSR